MTVSSSSSKNRVRCYTVILVIVLVVVLSQGVTFWCASSSSAGMNDSLWTTVTTNQAALVQPDAEPCPSESQSPPPAVPAQSARFRPFLPNGAGVAPNATCQDLMDHFHAISQAFRNGIQSSSSSSSSTITSSPPITPPLINYAFYQGQGFGRLVDHGMAHCLLSLALERPCLLDLTDRDTYYTWRSFINTGTYNWEFQTPELSSSLGPSVRTAVQALAKQGDGKWADPVPHTDDLHLLSQQPWGPGKSQSTKFWQAIAPWHPTKIPRALVSANWGSAWFPNLVPPAQYGACDPEELKTRIQNAMFQPTPLSIKLHQEQRLKVMKQPWRPYGAIHIRFVILELGRRPVNEPSMRKELDECLHYVAERTNVTDWWVLSDRPTRAINLTQHVSPQFKIHVTPQATTTKQFQQHSNSGSARGVFGHASMSESVLDWMILHQSQASIITQGSYALTGARGQGKSLQDHQCGVFNVLLPYDM